MKGFGEKHIVPYLVVAIIALGVFCYWYFLYPHVVVMRESLQLFLWNSDYFMERIAVPGGLAQYLGEFLVQYFMNPLSGAAIYALLFVVEQWLSARLLKRAFPSMKKSYRFGLSLIVPVILWWMAMIPEVSMTPTIAVILVMGAMLLIPSGKTARLICICIMIPVMYWLAGPVDYYWGKERRIGGQEEMECDLLMRMGQWDAVSSKFQYSHSATLQSAVKLADYMTGKIDGQELYASMVVPQELQNGPASFITDGLFLKVNFEGLVSAFMLSDMAFNMNMPAIAKRAAFEAMEFIPNYNKSGRALKRLVETNIITGHYKTALKYIAILEETACYDEWAREMRQLAEHPEKLQQQPFFKHSQESFQKAKDMFFI